MHRETKELTKMERKWKERSKIKEKWKILLIKLKWIGEINEQIRENERMGEI